MRGSSRRRVRLIRGPIPNDVQPTYSTKLGFGHGSYMLPHPPRQASPAPSPEELKKRRKDAKSEKVHERRMRSLHEHYETKSDAEIAALLRKPLLNGVCGGFSDYYFAKAAARLDPTHVAALVLLAKPIPASELADRLHEQATNMKHDDNEQVLLFEASKRLRAQAAIIGGDTFARIKASQALNSCRTLKQTVG